MFMGALLLLAAALTWSIGLMMSPHGETVANGTQYVRSTVVIFKRNGAIGTLVMCALAAWLLFPARRPKWPARDWALIASFVLLAGSSLYTLISLRLPSPAAEVQANLADADAEAAPEPNSNANVAVFSDTPTMNMVLPPVPDAQRFAIRNDNPPAPVRQGPDEQQPGGPKIVYPNEEIDSTGDVGPSDDSNQAEGNAAAENQE